jgi:hypothetical protein
MGEFYTNLTLVGAQLDDVRAHLPSGGLATQDGDCVVLYFDEDELLGGTGATIAAKLACPVVMASVHDGDILLIEVWHGSRSLVSGMIPDPSVVFGDEFDEMADEGAPRGLSAEELVSALGRGDVEAVRAALGGDDDDGYIDVSDCHLQLTVGLNIAQSAVGWGFNYISDAGDDYEGPPLVQL